MIRLRLFLLAVVSLSLATGSSRADLEFNNGTSNDFSGSESGSVFVDDNPSPPPLTTTLNVLTGASIGLDLTANGSSIVNLKDGSVGNNVNANNTSRVNISGGTVGGNVYANGNSVVTVSGGSIGADLNEMDAASLSITGGSGGNVIANGSGSVSISGGLFSGDLDVNGSGPVTYSGGSLGGMINVGDHAQLTILGTGLMVTPDGLFITGTLQDGTSLDIPFSVSPNGGSLVLEEPQTVPQPASFTLAGIGAATLLAFAWRKRKALAAA